MFGLLTELGTFYHASPKICQTERKRDADAQALWCWMNDQCRRRHSTKLASLLLTETHTRGQLLRTFSFTTRRLPLDTPTVIPRGTLSLLCLSKKGKSITSRHATSRTIPFSKCARQTDWKWLQLWRLERHTNFNHGALLCGRLDGEVSGVPEERRLHHRRELRWHLCSNFGPAHFECWGGIQGTS